MDKETLQALKGSIKKWERIVKTTTAKDDGIWNCPLCRLFHATVSINYLYESCLACPIYNKTNVPYCSGTPYKEWTDHQIGAHPKSNEEMYHRYAGCKECLTLAKEELKFLGSLLPKVVKK